MLCLQNRDPAGVEGFTPIDVEDRRRLWRSLVALDWLDYSPRPCAIMPAQFDTREPINAFDQNITLQGVKASERFDLTPALFTNTQSQLAIVGHTLNEYVYAVKPSASLAWKFFLDQNTTLGRLRSSLVPLAWNGDTVAPLDAKNFATDRFRVFLHMTALQLVIRLNRPLCVPLFPFSVFRDSLHAFAASRAAWRTRVSRRGGPAASRLRKSSSACPLRLY